MLLTLVLSCQQKILDQIKADHDLAKTVKSEYEEVPVQLWDNCICPGPFMNAPEKPHWDYGLTSEQQQIALGMFIGWIL